MPLRKKDINIEVEDLEKVMNDHFDFEPDEVERPEKEHFIKEFLIWLFSPFLVLSGIILVIVFLGWIVSWI